VAPSFALKQSEKIEVLMAEMEMEASVAAFPTLHGDNPSFFCFSIGIITFPWFPMVFP
jgi:hypothetical protein